MEARNRRSLLAGAVASLVSLWPKRAVILDYSNSNMGRLEAAYVGGKCFVDGVEIHAVWYLDQRAGFVRTYDIHGVGKGHKYEIDETGRDVKWREIRGHVRLFLPDGTEV